MDKIPKKLFGFPVKIVGRDSSLDAAFTVPSLTVFCKKCQEAKSISQREIVINGDRMEFGCPDCDEKFSLVY